MTVIQKLPFSFSKMSDLFANFLSFKLVFTAVDSLILQISYLVRSGTGCLKAEMAWQGKCHQTRASWEHSMNSLGQCLSAQTPSSRTPHPQLFCLSPIFLRGCWINCSGFSCVVLELGRLTLDRPGRPSKTS